MLELVVENGEMEGGEGVGGIPSTGRWRSWQFSLSNGGISQH